MKKIFILITILFILFFSINVEAKHLHLEKYYQKAWCDQNNGQCEYVLSNRTRVDCLTEQYAVEVDFASKWAESIGQSLSYAINTGKKPAVLLIIEDFEKDYHFINLLMSVANKYDITIFIINKNLQWFRLN